MDNEIQHLTNCVELDRLAEIYAILHHPAMARDLPAELSDARYGFCAKQSGEQEAQLAQFRDCCTRLFINRLAVLQKAVLFWPRFVEERATCAEAITQICANADEVCARRLRLPFRAILTALVLMVEQYPKFITLLAPFTRLAFHMYGLRPRGC